MNDQVAANTQNQAFNAILFLYRNVFNLSLGDDIQALRAKKTERVLNGIPLVLNSVSDLHIR